MPSVEKWSETAGSNGNADADINAAEGMNPSGVNDAIRGVMAGVARWDNDISGEVSTAGTSTAYTVTTNQTLTAYANGIRLALIIDETNTGASTLNVDGLGSKNIYKAQGSALTTLGAGDLVAGAIADLFYNSALNAAAGGWFLANPGISTAPAGSQPLDATLTAIAGQNFAADKIHYGTGVDTASTTTLTSFARTLIDDVDASTMRTTLGAAIGTNVQAWSAKLDTEAALTWAADKIAYQTSASALATTTLTSFARTVLDDTDAATMQATIGVPAAATQAEQETGSSTTAYVSPGRQHFHPSAAKCWAYIFLSGGVPSLTKGYNITSISDTANGQCTVTIATDFSDANWCAVLTAECSALSVRVPVTFTKTTGSIVLATMSQTPNYVDPDAYNFVGYGDI
jgi:hypothetical protein